MRMAVKPNGFNSRARKGRDLLSFLLLCLSACFNSRARKGRDTIRKSLEQWMYGFNSRARKGRDLPAAWRTPNWRRFQFTRPQGARRRVLITATTG